MQLRVQTTNTCVLTWAISKCKHIRCGNRKQNGASPSWLVLLWLRFFFTSSLIYRGISIILSSFFSGAMLPIFVSTAHKHITTLVNNVNRYQKTINVCLRYFIVTFSLFLIRPLSLSLLVPFNFSGFMITCDIFVFHYHFGLGISKLQSSECMCMFVFVCVCVCAYLRRKSSARKQNIARINHYCDNSLAICSILFLHSVSLCTSPTFSYSVCSSLHLSDSAMCECECEYVRWQRWKKIQ